MKMPWLGVAVFGVALVLAVRCLGLEPPRGCFRSVAEAVTQTRALDTAGNSGDKRGSGLGFRLEDVRRDALLNKSWAIVRSCEHPEYPAVTVAVAGPAKTEAGAAPVATPAASSLLVKAGATVRLVRTEANVRMEMPAVTVSGGMLGERIQVRVVRSTGDAVGGDLMVVGIVRGADVLEMEP